jgi:hypothetical protein
MDNDRDTTEHVMNLLEDLHALEARLAEVHQARRLLACSHYLAEIEVGLKAKEEVLLRRGLHIRAEIVQIVVDAEIERGGGKGDVEGHAVVAGGEGF